MPTIDTGSALVYVHPRAEVSISDKLGPPWTAQPYLHLRQLRMACSPEVGQATFRYDYGPIAREDQASPVTGYYLPIDLAGKFVRVVITDTVLAGAPPVPANSVIWHGVIQPDIRRPDGSTPPPDLIPSGHQDVVAFGLERLLEQQQVQTSLVDRDGTVDNLLTVQRGLPFNSDPDGDFPRRGNRSASPVPGDGSYVFSWAARESAEWNAYTAVEYLLAHHSPRTSTGAVANRWRIDGNSTILNWYDIAIPTERKTLKELLDALIPRSRGVSYWVDFDASVNECVVRPFTFVDADVALANGNVIPANPDQYDLNFENALDVSDVTISNTAISQFHRVLARGARRTTTLTARIKELTSGLWTPETILGPGWSQDQETEYKKAASTEPDYAGLDAQQQQFRNSVYRRSERLAAVYSQFILNPTTGATGWTCKVPRSHQPGSVEYWLAHDITGFDGLASPLTMDAKTNGVDWIPGLRILPRLPLYEQYDYSGTNLEDFVYGFAQRQPAFIKPLIYAQTSKEPKRFEALDRQHRPMLVPVNEQFRNWSVGVGVLSTCPGIELQTRVPHFLAGNDAGAGGDWANTADDELSEQHGGIEYSDIWATICVELNTHLEYELMLTPPADGAPVNVLLLSVPDARADYVLPYTTVEIKDGAPVQTLSGGWAKDDRARLATICRAAAEWYGKERQTLQMNMQQIRQLVQLGWLITSVGANYSMENINTPVTAITFDLGDGETPGHTRFETGFANLDFQAQ
jgi:hypothetical protein